MAEILTELSIRRVLGMRYIRFYVCHHGLRAPRGTAISIVTHRIIIEHQHVDIVQVHRADQLRCTDGDV